MLFCALELYNHQCKRPLCPPCVFKRLISMRLMWQAHRLILMEEQVKWIALPSLQLLAISRHLLLNIFKQEVVLVLVVVLVVGVRACLSSRNSSNSRRRVPVGIFGGLGEVCVVTMSAVCGWL